MLIYHLIFSTILLISMYAVVWAKYSNIVRINKLSPVEKIKNIIYVVVVTYTPIVNLSILISIIFAMYTSEQDMLSMLNRKEVLFKQKYKKLPLEFWEEIRPHAGKLDIDPDETPLELSDEVLSGKRKLKVTLPKKDTNI